MKISIIHPTRNRSHQAMITAERWRQNAANFADIEYILSVDKDDISDYTWAKHPVYGDSKVLFNNNKSAIGAINKAAEIAKGDLFIVISDDFECEINWDHILLKALEGKEDFIVKTQDGLQKTLITLPIMDRTYYNRFGYIYHPEYLHMHCDEEMTIIGHMLGRVITLDLTFIHNHYSTGKTEIDAINEKNNATWAHGQRTLDRHALNNFGIKNPLVKREDIVWR